MKINAEQLDKHLTQALSQVYLISGDETLLVQEITTMIRTAAFSHDFTEHERFNIEKGFAWQDLLLATKNLSLLGDKQLLELHLQSYKLEATGNELLQKYLEKPSKNKILLLIGPKLDAAAQKLKWVKAIETNGIIIQIWPIEHQALPMWLMQRAKQQGLNLDNESCKFLSEQVAGNLLAAAQELEKLKLCYGENKIGIEEVTSAVTNNAKYNLFGMIDCALQGNSKKVINMVNSLRAEGEEPILLLWALARELRLLLNIALEKQKGLPLDTILEKKGVWMKRKALVKNAVQKHSVTKLKNLLKKAAKIDKIIKGMAEGDAWRELLSLALNLSK
jgi:DNA polymerase III subunit delta